MLSPTHLCSDSTAGSISQQGLVLGCGEKGMEGWPVRNRHWAYGSQDVGSTHPVQRTGNQKSKDSQPQTGNFSASLCPGTQCSVHTKGSTVSTEDTGGSSRGPAHSAGRRVGVLMVPSAVPCKTVRMGQHSPALLETKEFLMDLINLNETKSNVKRFQRISC